MTDEIQELSLDPEDWESFRASAHEAVDIMTDYLRDIRSRPPWQRVPAESAHRFNARVPENPEGLESSLDDFYREVLPYPTGNIHPRFWSWVCGTGSPTGMLSEFLAAGMNSMGLGFDESSNSHVEMQVLDWLKYLMGFTPEATGLLVSGGSMANLVSLTVGRNLKCGYDIRKLGLCPDGHQRLVAYASTETHSSVQKALEMLGIGQDFFRKIPTNRAYEIDVGQLRAQIEADIADGLRPGLLVGNAGTVNTGAFDPLDSLADIAADHDLWFTVDGAFGSLARLTSIAPTNLRGLERADALAFDLHKWLHQPYNAGAVLIRDGSAHKASFEVTPAYLARDKSGVASGPTDFSSLGIQLSRSFVALRVWLSFKTHGVGRFRKLIEQNIQQARYLEARIQTAPHLEILAPTALNIVNYRYNPGNLEEEALNQLNAEILTALQTRGLAAPSSTRLDGRFSIRVCIANHRTRRHDLDELVEHTRQLGEDLRFTGLRD